MQLYDVLFNPFIDWCIWLSPSICRNPWFWSPTTINGPLNPLWEPSGQTATICPVLGRRLVQPPLHQLPSGAAVSPKPSPCFHHLLICFYPQQLKLLKPHLTAILVSRFSDSSVEPCSSSSSAPGRPFRGRRCSRLSDSASSNGSGSPEALGLSSHAANIGSGSRNHVYVGCMG